MDTSEEAATNCTPVNMFKLDYLDEIVSQEMRRTRVVSAVYGCICVVGLLANIALLVSLFLGGRRGATFKAPSTILIINLAIADALLLLTLPFAITHRAGNHWPFGLAFCKLEEVLKFLSYYASVFFITAMAVDRYCIMCRPATYDRRRARRNLWLVSILIWLFALLVVTPLMIYSGVDELGMCNILFPESKQDDMIQLDDYPLLNGTGCLEDYLYDLEYYGYEDEGSQDIMPICRHPSYRSLHIWLVCNFIIGFAIPFLIISVCYFNIIKLRSAIFSSRSNPIIRNSSHGSSSGTEEETDEENHPQRFRRDDIQPINQRAKLIMGILVPCLIIAFAGCWLPYHTWHLAQISGIHGVSVNTCTLIRDITFCLAFFNSALNPILNSIFLFDFKERLQRLSAWLKNFTHGSPRVTTPAEDEHKSSREQSSKRDSRSCEEVTFITSMLSDNHNQ